MYLIYLVVPKIDSLIVVWLVTGCSFWDESRFLSGTVKYAKCMLNHKKDLLGNKYAVRHSFRKIQNWKVYFGGSILHVKILLGYYGKFLKRIIFEYTRNVSKCCIHPKISNFIDFWLIWITISHKKIINSIYTLGFISGRTPCTPGWQKNIQY